jgi:hypothetical protein
LQATSAAMQGCKRQGITPLASLNTALATEIAPSSHWAGRVCAGPDRRGAGAAAETKACAGDRSDRRPGARPDRIYFVKFPDAVQAIALHGGDDQ